MEPASNAILRELNFETGSENHYLARYIQAKYRQAQPIQTQFRTEHGDKRIEVRPWVLTISITACIIVCITAGLLITFNTTELFTVSFGQRSLDPLAQASTLTATLSTSNVPTPLRQSTHIVRESIPEIDLLANASGLVQESTLRRLSFLKDEIEATQFAIQLISASQTALAEAELGQLQSRLDHLLQEYNYLQKIRFLPQSSAQTLRDSSILPSE